MRSHTGSFTRQILTVLAAGLPLLIGTSARAHSLAADLSVWGGFGGSAAQCQRSIARAATLCTARVLNARTICAAAQLRGEPCDLDDVAQRTAAARSRAVALVERACGAEDLQRLRYIDLDDAINDVSSTCRGLDTSAMSAAYAPAIFGDAIAEVDAETGACVDLTGRVATRLLRFAARARQHALDEIAVTPLPGPEGLLVKQALLERSKRMIDRAADLTKRRILAVCPAGQFEAAYGRSVDDLLARIAGRADCLAEAVYVQNAVTCPPTICGDAMVSGAEQCDDGNDYPGDGCKPDCTKANCDVFPTTYDMIQTSIFENHGCTSDACHGAASSGDLDLRAGASFAALKRKEPANSVPSMQRIYPGNERLSLLWLNLAALTLPDQYRAPLRGMPLGLEPISPEELEALRQWIVMGGAERDANIPSAANLLKACVPEPKPVKIDPLDPPAPGAGVQLHMPAWTLEPHSESEVCFSSYYDLTSQVPQQFLSADRQHFRYKSIDIRQDPLSHHLIVDLYRGSEAANDPIWGTYRCRAGAREGEVCDPLDVTFCGEGQCATDPDPTAIACIGFGPQTGLTTLTRGGFAFAQATTAQFHFPEGVYDELPLRGIVLWNSHAFNLTNTAGTLEGWVNILFPPADEQVYQQSQIFDASMIFWTDLTRIFSPPALPAFEEMEICNIHEFGPVAGFGGSLLNADETAHLFELSGHTHQRGTRFQILRGSFRCADGPNAGVACSPFQPEMCPASQCIEDGGRDPEDALLYTNYVYNDPLVLRLDPPIEISGSAPRADRTFTYCGHYDNGAGTHPEKVKRRSTSPPAGTILGTVKIGGPCSIAETRCMSGNHDLCNGNDAVCDSSPGAGDGDCDACPLRGGFRTEDEMFIMFGNYWVTKN